MNIEKQQTLLDLCFPRLFKHFSDLVSRLGGKKVEQNLKSLFLEHATGKGFKAGGGFNVSEASVDWEDYRKLVDELISFTTGVAGKKMVTREIRATISEIENETGENLYEIGFKLNLNQYLEN